MNGQPRNIPANVAPGQQVDLSVSLMAPNHPIIYQGFWRIETGKGYRFGQTIWVAITTLEDPEKTAATGQPTSYSLHLPQVAETNSPQRWMRLGVFAV